MVVRNDWRAPFSWVSFRRHLPSCWYGREQCFEMECIKVFDVDFTAIIARSIQIQNTSYMYPMYYGIWHSNLKPFITNTQHSNSKHSIQVSKILQYLAFKFEAIHYQPSAYKFKALHTLSKVLQHLAFKFKAFHTCIQTTPLGTQLALGIQIQSTSYII